MKLWEKTMDELEPGLIAGAMEYERKRSAGKRTHGRLSGRRLLPAAACLVLLLAGAAVILFRQAAARHRTLPIRALTSAIRPWPGRNWEKSPYWAAGTGYSTDLTGRRGRKADPKAAERSFGRKSSASAACRRIPRSA